MQRILKKNRKIAFDTHFPSETRPWREFFKDEIARYSEVGLILRGARLRAGLSQKVLAKKCGVTQNNLSNMEHGKRSIGLRDRSKITCTFQRVL